MFYYDVPNICELVAMLVSNNLVFTHALAEIAYEIESDKLIHLLNASTSTTIYLMDVLEFNCATEISNAVADVMKNVDAALSRFPQIIY